MALPFSEIAAAARIAYTIYDLGFSKYTSSHQEYLDFGNDISLLRDGLDAIVTSVNYANGQSTHGTARNGAANPQDLTSFCTIVGDFRDTLGRCEKLIKRNGHFSRDRHGFVNNVQWNSGLGKHVQYLRQRVSFHSVKINLVLLPLKVQMYTNIRRDISIVHRDIIDYLEEIIRKLSEGNGQEAVNMNDHFLDVPTFLEGKFQASATRADAASMALVPIEDIVDALALHLGNSTQKFVPQPPILSKPDTCQYINLVKSVWLVQQLQRNPSFETKCQDTLWGAYFRQLLRSVRFECRRFHDGETTLRAPDDQQIRQEADDKFEIWVTFDEVDDFDDLTEPTGLETLLFRANLPEVSGRTQQIVVFRVSTSRIRMVRILSRKNDRATENYEIDSQRVLLLPFYSFPDAEALSIGWKAHASDHRSQALTFNCLEDVQKLQEAITNFGVVADQTGVLSVSIKESTLSSVKSIGSGGRAQVWTYRPEPKQEQTPSEFDSASPRNSHLRQDSTLTGSSGQSGGPGVWARSYAASANASTSIYQSGTKALLERPVLAQLVIFTKGRKDLKCFIAIQLDDNTKLSPDSCHCNDPKKKCKRIVIKSDNKNGVAVNIYSTRAGQEDQWNLAVLSHPEHEDARRDVEQHRCKFIMVEFETVEAREQIMSSFESTCYIMQARVRIYHQDLRDSQNRNVAQ